MDGSYTATDTMNNSAPQSGTGSPASAGSFPGAGSPADGNNSSGGMPGNAESARPDPAEAAFQERLASAQAEQQQAWRSQVEQWRSEAETDPELGGEALSGTVARAQMALSRFDSKDHFIGNLLQQTGYGNHPEVLRFFSRLASGMMEDTLSAGDASGAGTVPLEERLYAKWKN